MEPLIKDKVQCTKCSSNIFLTSDKEQPLNKEQNGQKTMGPKRVRYSEVPLYMYSLVITSDPLPSVLEGEKTIANGFQWLGDIFLY